MLTADQLDALTEPILSIYREYETSVIADIARRLKNLDFASAAWQAQRLSESGALYKDILKQLAKLTGQSEQQIAETLKRAGVKTMQFDDAIYKRAGLNPLPLNLSPAMLATLKAGLDKTNGLVNNLTMSTALTAQQSFLYAADIAYMQVSTGAMSYNQAIRAAVKNVSANGLTTVNYASGHVDQLDVAMRRAILTGIGQTTGQLQINRADEMGQDLVAVSAHAGARNKGSGPMNHAEWQGKIYSRGGTHKKYPGFVEKTGYGTGPGLMGWNCRHSFYPFFDDISENAYTSEEVRSLNNQTVTYQGQQINLYDATQIQREHERKIRFWKRQAIALDAAKLDSTLERAKIAQWQERLRAFIRATGLDRQSVREQVLGYTRKGTPRTAAKTVPSKTISTEKPKPVQSTAQGAPVSEALDTAAVTNRAMREQIFLALREMDKIHGDGELPKIPIKESSSRREFGSYWSSGFTQAVKINLSKTSNHQALTLLHEIGHFLDHKGFGIENTWSSRSQIFGGGIVQVVKQSNWYKEIWKRFDEINSQISQDIPPLRIGRKYVNYLLSNKEIFARAYAQYIAVKSGNKELLAQLKKLQTQKFPSQWDDDDFAPIIAAFDELFTAKGWMK